MLTSGHPSLNSASTARAWASAGAPVRLPSTILGTGRPLTYLAAVSPKGSGGSLKG